MRGQAHHRLYTVYDNRTDELIILDGTSAECAKAMKMKINSFYAAVTRNKGPNDRWHIEAEKVIGGVENARRRH